MAGISNRRRMCGEEAQTRALRAALEPLRILHVNVDEFTLQHITDLNFTADKYLKQIKVLTAIKDIKVTDALFDAAMGEGLFNSVSTMTPAQLCEVALWACSKKGQRILNGICNSRKIQKKVYSKVEDLLHIEEIEDITWRVYEEECRAKGLPVLKRTPPKEVLE